ncbi:hypothetical protein ASG03_03455 [Rhizobium sp. Leaf341]|nr:hypothetical protein ASG03_03455 [Rhizobium sp. Leaf341]
MGIIYPTVEVRTNHIFHTTNRANVRRVDFIDDRTSNLHRLLCAAQARDSNCARAYTLFENECKTTTGKDIFRPSSAADDNIAASDEAPTSNNVPPISILLYPFDGFTRIISHVADQSRFRQTFRSLPWPTISSLRFVYRTSPGPAFQPPESGIQMLRFNEFDGI